MEWNYGVEQKTISKQSQLNVILVMTVNVSSSFIYILVDPYLR